MTKITEEELENISGGRLTTELPENLDDYYVYVRVVKIDGIQEIVGPWVLYTGPEVLPIIVKDVVGKYRLEYALVKK